MDDWRQHIPNGEIEILEISKVPKDQRWFVHATYAACKPSIKKSGLVKIIYIIIYIIFLSHPPRFFTNRVSTRSLFPKYFHLSFIFTTISLCCYFSHSIIV
jgi:hypothetical protein